MTVFVYDPYVTLVFSWDPMDYKSDDTLLCRRRRCKQNLCIELNNPELITNHKKTSNCTRDRYSHVTSTIWHVVEHRILEDFRCEWTRESVVIPNCKGHFPVFFCLVIYKLNTHVRTILISLVLVGGPLATTVLLNSLIACGTVHQIRTFFFVLWQCGLPFHFQAPTFDPFLLFLVIIFIIVLLFGQFLKLLYTSKKCLFYFVIFILHINNFQKLSLSCVVDKGELKKWDESGRDWLLIGWL